MRRFVLGGMLFLIVVVMICGMRMPVQATEESAEQPALMEEAQALNA